MIRSAARSTLLALSLVASAHVAAASAADALRTVAARDHAAFSAFLADEAVFMSGPQALRGKQRVAAEWKRYFEQAEAPFS